MLPPGFEEARLPDDDFNAYLYVSQTTPIAMPLAAFGESAGASTEPDLELSSLGAWVGPNLDSFGVRAEFQQQRQAQAAETALADDVENGGKAACCRWCAAGKYGRAMLRLR